MYACVVLISLCKIQILGAQEGKSKRALFHRRVIRSDAKLGFLCRLENDWENFAELVQEIEANQNHEEVKRIEVRLWRDRTLPSTIINKNNIISTLSSSCALGTCRASLVFTA